MVTNERRTNNRVNLEQVRSWTVNRADFCKTGRWTWRHNNIVNYVVKSLDYSKYTVFSDIEGHEAPGGGTLFLQRSL